MMPAIAPTTGSAKYDSKKIRLRIARVLMRRTGTGVEASVHGGEPVVVTSFTELDSPRTASDGHTRE
jgi:hypothetical protein